MGTVALLHTSERSGQGNGAPTTPLIVIEMTFEERFSELRPSLDKYALSLTRNREEAEDLVQECAYKAFKAWPKTRPERFRVYVVQILYNTFYDRKRALKRRVPTASPSQDPDITFAMECLIKEEANPLPLEFYDVLASASGQLSSGQKRAIELTLQGLSVAEISAEMGIPEGTIKSRVSRARGVLRDLIQP